MTNREPPTLTDEERRLVSLNLGEIIRAENDRGGKERRLSAAMVSLLRHHSWLEARETERRERQMTHSADCWKWHVICAQGKIEELLDQHAMDTAGVESMNRQVEQLTTERNNLRTLTESYSDKADDMGRQRDQYEHDRDATAGELATVRHDVEDIAVELSEAITGLEREWERGKIRQHNIDQLGVIVTRLRVHAPTTTEGEQ